MTRLLASVSIAALAAAFAATAFTSAAHAQEGTIAKAVGGYTFEDAAKEAEGRVT